MKMKQVYFLRPVFPILFFILSILAGCSSSGEKEKAILGLWNAHWQTEADASMPDLSDENLHMTGVINFMEDGKVEISAFGFDGCIFYEDTLMNTLNWKISDSELRFIDQGDDQGLPYTINKFSSNELHLTLLDDINLILSRN